jgi:phosphatidylglycerophosphate synthase
MERSFRRAIAELASAQKTSRGVSLYTRFVNRPVGRVLAAACFKLGMSPNQVTAASAVFTLGGLAVLLAGRPDLLRAVIVALLLMLGFALDSADGQVARLTNRGSRAGEWLDHVVDSAKIVAIHAAVLITAFRYFELAPWWLVVPLAFQVVSIVTFFGGELERLLRVPNGFAAAGREPSRLRALALLPADYGVLAASFVLIGWGPLFFGAYTVLFFTNLVIMALLLAKWFRALSVVG